MTKLRRNIFGPPAITFLMLALSVVVLFTDVHAQEAPRDSGSLIKPPTIKPPTANSQTGGGSGTATSTRTSARRRRRARRRTAAIKAETKPREVQGVVVDSNDSMPTSAPESPPAPTPPPPKPRSPISFGVLNGKAIRLPKPVYPAVAKAARASGTVTVQVMIDEYGNVTEARAVSGHPLLRAAAEDAARNAMFSPTQLSGQPVKVSGVLTYQFSQ